MMLTNEARNAIARYTARTAASREKRAKAMARKRARTNKPKNT